PQCPLLPYTALFRSQGKSDLFVGRRYGDFARLHKQLQTEFPGKLLPVLPKKNKTSTTTSWWSAPVDDDDASLSSLSTQETGAQRDRKSTRLNSSHVS